LAGMDPLECMVLQPPPPSSPLQRVHTIHLLQYAVVELG
jgi:hypothetical protein